MAIRRMFSIRLINSAKFLRMPISSQALYFHLGLHADDDGVVEAYPIIKTVGCTEDDLRVLVTKGFVNVLNDDLVTYITDWNEHNKIRADRKIDSIYKDLLLELVPDAHLLEKKPRADRLGTDKGQPRDNQGSAEDRLGKDRLGKDSQDEVNLSPSQVREEFEELWKLYPKKHGKKRAYNEYERTRVKHGVEFETIKNGMKAYIRWFSNQRKDIQYMKDGDTFFSQWSWQDDWSASGRINSQFAKEADDILDGIL